MQNVFDCFTDDFEEFRHPGAAPSPARLDLVNHHIYRLGTHLAVSSEVLTGTLEVHYFFLMKCKYRTQVQHPPHVQTVTWKSEVVF